ncbi:MAG: c-type cytochrome [Thermonemataceae bacterium]
MKRLIKVKSLLAFTLVFLWAAPAMMAQEDSTAQAQAQSGGDSDVSVDHGKELFNANCLTCHNPTDVPKTGPGLKGVTDRRSESWIIAWIQNSQKLIQSGDKQAVALYEEYNKLAMPAYEDFTEYDIKSILAYIDAYEPVVVDDKGGDETTVDGTATAGGEYLNLLLGGMIVLLLLVLVVLIIITQLLTRFLKQDENLDEADKEVVNQRFDLGAVFQSKAFLTVVGVFFFLVVSKAGIDKVMNIGIQAGYAPTQPIAFSHKLHAGANEVDCGYCHTGVYKGKSANIPSANICMNCHNQIKRSSPEIQKIYAAIENDQPIEWVRVHNLPDLVYFNHAQHTVAGQLECQNCHGQIEEMEVVQQRAPLTMGWCIDCHRETVVQGAADESNEYYDRLRAAHAKDGLKAADIKVKDIGGLECSKCHY